MPKLGITRFVLAIAMAGSCAFAQSDNTQKIATTESSATAVTELAPITVSARGGSALASDEIGVSVSILNTKKLRGEGILNLSDALADTPGVFVLPGGGVGQKGNNSNIAIRGMSKSGYTLTTMDGMRIKASGALITPGIIGRTNLFDVGTLEVLRGSQAAVYGGGAVGGVIYMETPEGQGDPSLSLFNEYGSFDSYTGNITAQGRIDKLSFFVSSTYTRTDNDLSYLDGSKPSEKKAGKYQNWQEAIRLDYRSNEDNKTTLTYRREDSSYNDISYGEYKYRNNLLSAKHETKINELYTTSLMAGYYGFDNTLGTGSYYELRNVQTQWDNELTWNDKNSTQLGFAWNRNDFSSTFLTADGVEDIYGFYINHSVEPVKNWTNDFALRLDNSSIFNNHVTYRAASSYKFNQEKTRVFGSFGNGYLTPTDFQRNIKNYVTSYTDWYTGKLKTTTYNGNSKLDVETSISFDFGIEQKIAEDHTVSATYFWIQQTDAIKAIYSSTQEDFTDVTYENANGHWMSQGLELALQGVIEKTWNTKYSLAWTLTQPKDENDKQIINTARQTWVLDLNTSPSEKLTIGTGFTAALGRMDYESRVDNYFIMRAYAQYKVNENVKLHLRIENLLNQKYVTNEAWGSNESKSSLNSGAAIYGGCTISF